MDKESRLSPDMTLEKLADGYRLQTTISDTWQLQWWLLSRGDALVVEPQGLRERIAAKFRQAAARYEYVHEKKREVCT